MEYVLHVVPHQTSSWKWFWGWWRLGPRLLSLACWLLHLYLAGHCMHQTSLCWPPRCCGQSPWFWVLFTPQAAQALDWAGVWCHWAGPVQWGIMYSLLLLLIPCVAGSACWPHSKACSAGVARADLVLWALPIAQGASIRCKLHVVPCQTALCAGSGTAQSRLAPEPMHRVGQAHASFTL